MTARITRTEVYAQGIFLLIAEEALAQIDGKGYLLPYRAEGKTLVKVGVEFDREKRTIGKWVEKVD